MKSFFLLLVAVAAVGASPLSFFDVSDYSGVFQEEWNAFKLEHKKTYETETEERLRMKIFAENKAKVARHNQRFARGEEYYRLAVNKFADMMYHEFTDTVCGYIPRNKSSEEREATYISLGNLTPPPHADWRTLGAVTPVKDQGKCRSCWAFSAAGALEGQHFRKSGSLVPLSEQNLVDCDTRNFGCNGGDMSTAFNYIERNKGIDIENAYPYEGIKKKCRYNPLSKGAEDLGFRLLPDGNEYELMKAVATFGPVSVAVHVEDEFRLYSKGIYFGKNCDGLINHAMLVVGYGTSKNGIDYWLVKNSYGPEWGEEGYVRWARNRNNVCGIASEAVFPLV